MTAFSGLTFLSQHGNSAQQVAELQRAIRKYRRRLEEFRERRRRAEEEITQCILRQLLKECSKEAHPGINQSGCGYAVQTQTPTQTTRKHQDLKVISSEAHLAKHVGRGRRLTLLPSSEAETRRRVDFIMGKDAVVLSLMELGQVLQEERQLSEQLNGQASEDRNDLQERMEGITNKARSLAAEIGKVKEQLAEGKARNMAAHALIQTPTGKSKTNPSE